MYVRNAWYVACSRDEIKAAPLGRTICGERIVFYRGEGGPSRRSRTSARTAARRCRWAVSRRQPLVCGYHGLEMGCDGKTVAMPGPARALRRSKHTRSSSATASSGSGQAMRAADPALLHPLDWAESPEWAYGGGLFHVKCDYRLMIDNLMDLTHETYVHSTSIGQPEIDEQRRSPSVEGDTSVTSRHMKNIMAPPFWRMAMRGNHLADDVPVDRWQICRFTPPSHVLIEVGVAHAGHGGYDAPPSARPRASWSTSSRPRPRRRSGTSGAWRATSTRTTRR